MVIECDGQRPNDWKTLLTGNLTTWKNEPTERRKIIVLKIIQSL